MASKTLFVLVGDYTFEVVVERTLSPRMINADGDIITTSTLELTSSDEITVTRDGAYITSGTLDVFDESYMRSRAYQDIFGAAVAKPVARLGGMCLGQKATASLLEALEIARAEMTTPEIAAYIAMEKEAERKAEEESAKYDAHMKSMGRMMTLRGGTY